MKGEKITDDTALDLAVNLMLNPDALLGTSSAVDASRKDVVNFVSLDGFIVDTCKAFDTGAWETGVKDERYSDSWIIVGQYHDREAAVVGQQGWVDALTNKPPK